MTYSAALVIIAACIGIALVLSAPLLYLSHLRRRKRLAKGESVAPSLPMTELRTLLAYVLVMFFGFAQAYIAPNTWFGHLIAPGTGVVMFLLPPGLLGIALRIAWLHYQGPRKDWRR